MPGLASESLESVPDDVCAHAHIYTEISYNCEFLTRLQESVSVLSQMLCALIRIEMCVILTAAK